MYVASANLAIINEVRVRGCTAAPCVIVRGEIHYVEVYATSRELNNYLKKYS